ncbi:hypothetical protein SELMODRAFT_114454 [Selaginella moellendorffii]|uniref:KATNIP domain-containing protein n=1 Tax=Selaginella moellendorffii TaxID=88036 RepID=D8SDP2_SELML|nr:hypothetical protein SELMODRAFT_114454 [Selaginella moellendorffii]
MLDESADKAALLQALSYTDDADLEELDGDEQQISELVAPSDFSIPLLPLGMKLTIDIHSSWGDPHYVGLSGIEIFDDAGQVVHIDSRKQISVGYTTAALLSGLNCSPCPVERLVDNVNLTCDDSHMWLAPFSPGHPCTITISLEGPTLLGMVRFWNYNKSTMHTYRGARLIRMFLDSQLIFYGELRRASGLLSDAYNNAEPILFTNNEVSSFIFFLSFHFMCRDVFQASLCAIEMHDAQTYKKKGSPGSDGLHDMNEDTEAYIGSPLQNPVFKLPVPSSQGKRVGQSLHDHCGSDKAPMGRVLRLNLLRSWGDCYYFGLTGIQAHLFLQVLDENGNAHSIQSEFITGKPRDLNDIPGHTGDYRTLDKLVDGCNVTTDDRHMWLVPYDGPEAEHFLEIDFKRPVTMSAFRFWNYNKSLDDTFRGVKWIQVLVDNVEVSPAGGFLLRKGMCFNLIFQSQLGFQLPGRTKNVKQRRIYAKLVLQEYLTPLFPSGHVIKFVLLSTWGDHQYLGLNGIELFDELGQSVPVLKRILRALTYATDNVHVLPDMTTHFSNPEKLFNGVNNTWDTQNMWLSVRDYTEGNQIYLYFNEPVMLSLVKIWNYSRNPTFGVREIEILVDDLLVYKGYVRKAIAANSRHLIDSEICPHSILFSSDEQTLRDNEDNVFYCGGVPNTDIILINDNYVVSDGSNALVTK